MIPGELIALPHWVAWLYVQRKGRVTKVPIDARTGSSASVTDAATWTDYATATTCARRHGWGVGFVLGDGIAGVDLDDCMTEAGELTPSAQAIVKELDSYTDVSPSGHGVHVYVRATLPPGRRRTGKIEIPRVGKVEMYGGAHYFAVTGRHLPGTRHTVEDRTTELTALHTRIFGVTETTGVRRPTARAMVSASDREILDRAHRARNGNRFARLWNGDASAYASASEADMALCSMLAFHTDDSEQIARLVAQSGLAREKWQRNDYRERTIAAALASADARRATQAASCDAFDALVARELEL